MQQQINILPLQRRILQCAANKQTTTTTITGTSVCWQGSTRQAPEGLNNSAGVSWTSPTLSCLICSELKRVKYNKGWQISHAAQPIHCGTEVITTIKQERAFFNLIMGYYGYTVGTRHSQGWAASLHNQIILTGTAAFIKMLTQRNNTMPGLLSLKHAILQIAWLLLLDTLCWDLKWIKRMMHQSTKEENMPKHKQVMRQTTNVKTMHGEKLQSCFFLDYYFPEISDETEKSSDLSDLMSGNEIHSVWWNQRSLTVLLPFSDAVADGLLQAESGCCGHRAQDGRQGRGFSLRDVAVLLVLLFLLWTLLLQSDERLQRELADLFAEVFGHSLQLVFLFCVLVVFDLRRCGDDFLDVVYTVCGRRKQSVIGS